MSMLDMEFDTRNDRCGPLASALADALDPVANELRLVNAADFIVFAYDEKFANIQDIVNSSVELFFKPGTLLFGWGAQFELDWDRVPAIILDMEFRHHSVWIVFKLILRARQTTARIEHFSVGKISGGPSQDLALLVETLADARLGSSKDRA